MQRETPLTIAADHPAFAGHFPGTPIVPGAVLLDEALFLIDAAGDLRTRTCTIVATKFFHPVGPGAILSLRHEVLADGSIRFEVTAGSRKIASGSIMPHAAEAGAAGSPG